MFTIYGLTSIVGTLGHTANTGTHNFNNVTLSGTLNMNSSQTINVSGFRSIGGTLTIA